MELSLTPSMPVWARPTRLSSTIFSAKVFAFRLQRLAQDFLAPPPRLSKAGTEAYPFRMAQSRTALWSDTNPAEQKAQRGKVQNLRIACAQLDGLLIPAGSVFSFWRHVGAPIAARGFVPGRMLQQGCMVSAVGGGLCQLSNALYDIALQSGCLIVERHAHSRIVPGSAAAIGRDATVAWNYVDLRFVSAQDIRLTAQLDGDGLIVSFGAASESKQEATQATPSQQRSSARSCASCGEIKCFRYEGR